MKILVTGGAGFIGSNLVRHLLTESEHEVLNVDKLTYAGNVESLADVAANPRYEFAQIDLCDSDAVHKVVDDFQPDAVMHLAAESHVDRSIDSPGDFIQTNVIGTYNLLQASLAHYRARREWREASGEKREREEREEREPSDHLSRHSPLATRNSGSAGRHSPLATRNSGSAGRHSPLAARNSGEAGRHSPLATRRFVFLHVSTDEVYGSLAPRDPAFTETTPYTPHSPYSASKASSDHLARAWHDTYGLPVMVTNCSNNYGPYQFPEKLIPVVILKCLRGEPIPVYGKGENVRDWLYVEDHCRALRTVLERGTPGETYNIGGNNEQRNIDLVRMLCDIMDELRPMDSSSRHSPLAARHSGEAGRHSSLISFVTDRPGHDLRYAIDASKIERELGWTPQEDFQSGFRKTIRWYLDNETWWQNILDGTYKLERQGVGG